MTIAPEFASYQTDKHGEFILRFQSNSSSQVLCIEPLLEERNFLRRTVIAFARDLAGQGIGCAIPDLPGCGESLIDMADLRLDQWRAAVTDAAACLTAETGCPPHLAAFRGGSLIDDTAVAASRWRFAPVSGSDLLRPLRYARRLAGDDALDDLMGYRLNAEMIADLEDAVPADTPGPLRIAEGRASGAALWRRAEPDEDPDLTESLAADFIQWMATCGAA